MPTKSQLLRKEQVVSGLIDIRQNLLSEAAGVPGEQHDEVFLGIWSIKDLLAHVIGWDLTNLNAVKRIQKGKLPEFYKHYDREWQAYNAILVKKHKKGTLTELLSRARKTQEQLLAFLNTIPPEDFNRDFGVRFRGYKVTIQRLLEAETADEKTHLQQILDYFSPSS